MLSALSLLQVGFVLGESNFTPATAEQAFFTAIKFMFVIAGLLYVAFGFIVTRQIHVMKDTLITPFSPIIQLLGYVHLVVAILLFLFFLSL